MANLSNFEQQRLFTERLADEHGTEVLRQVAMRYGDPEVVAGLYCRIFARVFEISMQRRERRRRGSEAEAWLLSVARQTLDASDTFAVPNVDVEADLVMMLEAGIDAIDHVPPSLVVRNLQFIRASVARARANLHHRGPLWLKAATLATVVVAVAAVIWGIYT